jgi:AraC family transcriptional regulator
MSGKQMGSWDAENGTWREISGVWKQIYGCFPKLGVSIEWHDFRLNKPLLWSGSFHEHSLEICLNYSGHAQIGREKTARNIGASGVAVYATSETPVRAMREDDSVHRFITLEFSPSFLAEEMSSVIDRVHPAVRSFIDHPKTAPSLIDLRTIAPHLLLYREHLLNPPVPESAFSLWYWAKISEILSSLLFQPPAGQELFCKQHQRQNREICERMLYLLERDMENPPPLEMLAEEFGRSPFQLSRLFSDVTGQTIPATLRRIRIERAAALLLDTKKSVTEIAFAVGYSSIGAFNKAFLEQIGKAPSAYRNG